MRNVPSRFTLMMRRHSAKSMSSHAVNGTMAALLTSTSRRPCRATTPSTRAWTCAGSEISVAMAWPPTAAAAASPLAESRSATTTVAPSSASLSTMARPMPWAPPVTMAIRPSSLPMPCSSSAPVVLGRVLPTVPRVHLMRDEDLGVVLAGHLLDAADGLDGLDRIEVEAADDLPVQRLLRVHGVAREDHRLATLGLGEQRDVRDRVPGR